MLERIVLMLCAFLAVLPASTFVEANKRPGLPRGLQVRVITPKTALVTIQPPASPGAPLTGYRLFYNSTTPGLHHHGTVFPSPASRLFVLFALEEDAVYNVTLFASNKWGEGPGLSTSAVTQPDSPSGPAAMLRAKDITKTSITIEWAPPPIIKQNGRLTGYVINFVQAGASQDLPLSVTVDSNVHQWTFSDMLPFTTYSIRVAATNEVGVGPFGEGITARTHEDVPDKPIIVGVAVLFHSMFVRVRDPTLARGTLWDVSYLVDGMEVIRRVPSQSALIMINPIAVGKTYRLRVRSSNSAGVGAWSDEWLQTASPIVDNITAVATGCKAKVCYQLQPLAGRASSVTHLRVHYSQCNNRSHIETSSHPMGEGSCLLVDHLLPEQCYTLRFEAQVRIGGVAVPADLSKEFRVQTAPCILEAIERVNQTLEDSSNSTEHDLDDDVCSPRKTLIGGFYSGLKDVPYYCHPSWVVTRCQPVKPIPGKSCVPLRSKLSSIPFLCSSLSEGKRRKIELKVVKDMKCVVVDAKAIEV